LYYQNIAGCSILAPAVKDNTQHLVKMFRCRNNIFLNAKGIDLKEPLTEIDCAGTAGILISRSAIMACGLYDGDHYFVGWEDFDYCYRVRKNRGKIFAIKDAVYFHPNLDEKYNKNYGKYMNIVLQGFKGILPPFLGLLKRNSSYREQKAIEAYVFLFSQYATSRLFYFILIYSIFRTVVMNMVNRNLDFKMTLQQYRKAVKQIIKE
jgi:GT2 family glycosyltransferase